MTAPNYPLDDHGVRLPCVACMQRPKQLATHYSPDSGEACCDACGREIAAFEDECAAADAFVTASTLPAPPPDDGDAVIGLCVGCL